MTQYSKSMASSWGSSAPGGVGQEHRVLSGIDGVLLVVVIGDGKLVVPVDFAIRRPDLRALGRRVATNCTGSRSC